ncbi:unnamed protein product [Durusdinium trenchii]
MDLPEEVVLATLKAASAADRSDELGLRVLVLESGLATFELRSLPQLLELEGPHEVASIEEDPHVSDAGARLVRHALGEHLSHVRHLPLVTGEETTLLELLQSLREGYDLPSFDLVVLGGRNVQGCVLEVQDLLKSQALRPRGVVLAIFDDDAAQMYLHEIGPEFDSVVTDDPDGATTVMSVWQRERKEL